MLLKIIIFIILLVTPPYGWVGLLLWLVWSSARASMKEQKEKEKTASVKQSASAVPAEPELLTAKVNNGCCDLYSVSTGSYVRRVGSDVVQACTGRDYAAVVTRQGYVDIYTASSGSYVRRLGSEAVSAQIQGDDIAITDKNGRVTLYNISNGSYIRCL